MCQLGIKPFQNQPKSTINKNNKVCNITIALVAPLAFKGYMCHTFLKQLLLIIDLQKSTEIRISQIIY